MWQRALSVSLNNLGDLAVAQGNATEALQLFAESLSILQSLAASDPGNATRLHDVWVSHFRIASTLEMLKQPDAASHWRKAYEILAGMVEARLHVSPQDREFLEQLRAKVGE